MNKTKYKSVFLFAVIGGIIGFSFHVIWHCKSGIKLFNLAPHVVSGTVYTVIGVIVGVAISYLLKMGVK